MPVSVSFEQLEDRRLLAYATEFAFGLGGDDSTNANDVATDRFGNAYVVGDFEGTVDFHPARSKTREMTAASTGPSAGDGFVAKYSPSGALLWARQFGSATGGAPISSVATDREGNVYLVGPLHATVDFDPGAGVAERSPGPDGSDVFIVKLTAGGEFAWVTRVGTEDRDAPWFNSGLFASFPDIAVDDLGYVHVAFNVETDGVLTPVLAKFNARGRNVYMHHFGVPGSTNAWARGLAADRFGNVFLAGHHSSNSAQTSLDLDAGPGSDPVARGRAFLAKYGADGEIEWVNHWGTSNDVTINDVAVDRSGWVYIGGRYQFEQDFNPHPNSTYFLHGRKGPDAFLAKYSPSGAFSWVKGPSSTLQNEIQAITVTSAGTVLVGGKMYGRIEFNPGGTSWYFADFGTSTHDRRTAFTAEYSANGDLGNVYAFTDSFGFSALASGPSRQIWGVGTQIVPHQMDFDPGAGTWHIARMGSFDGFVMKRTRV